MDTPLRIAIVVDHLVELAVVLRKSAATVVRRRRVGVSRAVRLRQNQEVSLLHLDLLALSVHCIAFDEPVSDELPVTN